MNRIVIRSIDRAAILRRERVKEFEYDENILRFSDEAQDWIELLLMMNHSFTVDFYTEGTKNAANLFNEIVLRAAGYAALAKERT